MRIAAITALAGALAVLSPVSATAAIIFSDPGGNYSEMLHNNSFPSGTTVTLESKPSGDLVDLISPSVLDPGGNGNGFAKVNGPFTELTIDPQDPLLGFSKIGFTLDPQKKFGGANLDDYSFKVDLTFVGGGFQTLSWAFPSFEKFDIWQEATDPGAIATVRIYGLTGVTTEKVDTEVCTTGPKGLKCKIEKVDVAVEHTGLTFEDIRHISYEGLYGAVVPEPATWAMMIIGFGGVGALMRRRRAALA